MRIARFTPPVLTKQQAALYKEIAGGPRSTGPQLFRLTGDDDALEGPFNAFLLQPEVGRALQALGAAVRYQTSLTNRSRELAILVVASRWNSTFEWYAHEAVGRHVGLSDAEFEAVRTRDYSAFTDPAELAVVSAADALAWSEDLDDNQYSHAATTLGEAQLFELITLVGYYAALALQLRVFRVPSPATTSTAPTTPA